MQTVLVAGRRPASSTAASATHTAQSLPRLPVPDLHKTLRGYLKSLEPFLLEQESRGGQPFQDAYEARVRLVEDFERDIGKSCQRRLLGTSPKFIP